MVLARVMVDINTLRIVEVREVDVLFFSLVIAMLLS